MAHPQVTTIAVQYCTVHAHIIGSDGPPLANVPVYLYQKDYGGDGHTSHTDTNDDVTFRSIDSRYEYAIDAQTDGYAEASSGYIKSMSGADIAFLLTLPKADSFASGTVVDRFGRPMGGVDVRLIVECIESMPGDLAVNILANDHDIIRPTGKMGDPSDKIHLVNFGAKPDKTALHFHQGIGKSGKRGCLASEYSNAGKHVAKR
jgi:hypothetical protein